MFNIKKNENLSNDNEYKGTFARLGIHIYRNEAYNVQPWIVMNNIVSTKGFNKGQIVSKVGFCLMKGKFLKLARKGTLNSGATITFSGYACPVQTLPGVAHIIWPNDIHQLNGMDHSKPFPDSNKAIVGMVISHKPVKYDNIPEKGKYIYHYKQWEKSLSNKMALQR